MFALSSCGDSSSKTNPDESNSETEAVATIGYTYQAAAKSLDKSLSFGLCKLDRTTVDNSNIGAIMNALSGKSIESLIFTSVTNITAIFSDLSGTLKSISADGCLVNIGNKVFEACTLLNSVNLGECRNIDIKSDSFPPNTQAKFRIPKERISDVFVLYENASFVDSIVITLSPTNSFVSASINEKLLRTANIQKKRIIAYKGDTLTVSVPTADGFDFRGYYADPEAQEKKVFDKNGEILRDVSPYTGINYDWIYLDGDITLYAGWKVLKDFSIDVSTDINVDFNPNNSENGLLGDNTSTQIFTRQQPVGWDHLNITEADIPENGERKISGFYLDKEFTTRLFNGDMSAVSGNVKVDGTDDEYYIIDGEWAYSGSNAVTLFAKWADKSVITLVSNGGESNGYAEIYPGHKSFESFTHASGKYAIDYYSTDEAGGTAVIYGDGTLSSNLGEYTDENGTWVPEGAATLYARYKSGSEALKESVIVTLSPTNSYLTGPTWASSKSGIVQTQPKVLVYAGDSISVKTPSMVGFEFQGYYTDRNAVEQKVFAKDGSLVKDSDGFSAGGKWITTASDITLYARWKPTGTLNDGFESSLSVDFNPSGTETLTGEATQTLTVNSGAATLSLSDAEIPVSAGKRVMGYYLDKDFTVKVFNADRSAVNGDVVYGGEVYIFDGMWGFTGPSATIYVKWAAPVTVTLLKNAPSMAVEEEYRDGTATIYPGSKTFESITHASGPFTVDYYGDGIVAARDTPVIFIDSNGNTYLYNESATSYTDLYGCWIYEDDINLYTHYTTTAIINPKT